jgi:endonuclease/exonuclease/phosphatase family metal-dependent hydrolase
MRLICWNLGYAAGRWRDNPILHERAWHWLAAVDPDVALLQEVEPPDWARERWQVHALPHHFWASAIVARHGIPLHVVEPPPDGLVAHHGAYHAVAETSLADGTPLLVASVHTPAREAPAWATKGQDRTAIARQSVGVPWWNDVAFAGFRDLAAGRRFLVGGDWNTSRYVDAEGVPNAAGAEFFERATGDGWIELSLDGDGREQRTWYGSTNPRPHQPDHVFADAETAGTVRSFAIDPSPIVLHDLSDHAPLILELDLELALPDPAQPAGARTEG